MSLRFSVLTPEQAWLPFEPTAQRPFDRPLASHLFRRAGFAASSRELDLAVRLGPQAAVKRLMEADDRQGDFDRQSRELAEVALAAGSFDLLAAWWLHRMRHTPAPLVEKMTLFWHGHFATSGAKVREVPLMYAQNELLRRHALGSFADLVKGIARDPAMLLYLDSATNRKIHPNENFAREVMELFCLGIGHYSEKDIRELARCFTGFEVQNGQFKFNPYQHDTGNKTILGKSGPFDADAGLAIILDQPAAAEFICTKLIRFFITEEQELAAEWVAPLAERFRDAKLMVAPVVETILTSRLFYSEAALGRKIRSPVELVVGLLRAVEATANLRQIAGRLDDLGQRLFFPPNVKGWPGGRAWIDSATLLGRANLVRAVIESPQTRFGGATLEAYMSRFDLATPPAIVGWLCELLLAVPLEPAVRSQLIALLVEAGGLQSAALKRLFHVLGSLPEFQLA